MADHLGNVRVVLNDAKNSVGLNSVTAAYDYYPFGMIARSYSPTSSRYGFGGQEMDNEVTGISGTHYTAEYWMYDSRLGRRWNVDPLRVAWESPYAAFRNSPIYYNDPDGDCPDGDCDDIPKDVEGVDYKQTSVTVTTTSNKMAYRNEINTVTETITNVVGEWVQDDKYGKAYRETVNIITNSVEMDFQGNVIKQTQTTSESMTDYRLAEKSYAGVIDQYLEELASIGPVNKSSPLLELSDNLEKSVALQKEYTTRVVNWRLGGEDIVSSNLGYMTSNYWSRQNKNATKNPAYGDQLGIVNAGMSLATMSNSLTIFSNKEIERGTEKPKIIIHNNYETIREKFNSVKHR